MSDFKIPDLMMPTDAELRVSALNWFERIGPTLIDRWPKELAALSMPTKFVPVPVNDFIDLYDTTVSVPSQPIIDLANEIDALMGWERHFIRLNSRSPKDGCWPSEVPITMSGKEAVSFLRCSERALDDLCRFRHLPEHPALICLRDHCPGISKHNEFRCFVKDGVLIAVTHYHYFTPIEPPEDKGAEIRGIIELFFQTKLKAALPLETVVFDLALLYRDEPLLIEINPYGLSDPCWFKSYQAVENANSFVQWSDPA